MVVMWATTLAVVAVFACVTSGDITLKHYKGCFSSRFVDSWAFYYKLNLSLPWEEAVAACNYRLTRYIGLMVDKSEPTFHSVYCGNDLVEVSTPSTNASQCQPCSFNSSNYCGGEGVMSVYSLEVSNNLTLLLVTNQGLEMLMDNTTKLKIELRSSSIYKYVDYIYTDNMIIIQADKDLYKSFYNVLNMKFSQSYSLKQFPNYVFSLGADFVQREAYFGYYGNGNLYKTTISKYQEYLLQDYSDTPVQISVDPYNRSLVFLKNPFEHIHIYTWSGVWEELSLRNNYHVNKIKAITLDIQKQLVYSILTLTGDSDTYLVSLDYGLGDMRVLLKGPQLVGVKTLEVFRGEAVWLVDVAGVSVIHRCALAPKCHPNNIMSYYSSQIIYDFTIYHPEKQTPGEKRLCANMSCIHGCRASSPFTARCSCPPGMEMGPDNINCYAIPKTSTQISLETTETEEDTTELQLITKPKTSSDISDSSPTSPPATHSTTHLVVPATRGSEGAMSTFEISVVICIVIMVAGLVGLSITVIVYIRKMFEVQHALVQCHELVALPNHYEVPRLLK